MGFWREIQTRREIVPKPIPRQEPSKTLSRPSTHPAPLPKIQRDVPRKPWAELLAHGFGVDAFLCPTRRTHGVSLHGGRAGDAEGSGRSGAFAGTAVEGLEVRRPGGVAERHAGPEGGGAAEVGISGEWRGV